MGQSESGHNDDETEAKEAQEEVQEKQDDDDEETETETDKDEEGDFSGQFDDEDYKGVVFYEKTFYATCNTRQEFSPAGCYLTAN